MKKLLHTTEERIAREKSQHAETIKRLKIVDRFVQSTPAERVKLYERNALWRKHYAMKVDYDMKGNIDRTGKMKRDFLREVFRDALVVVVRKRSLYAMNLATLRMNDKPHFDMLIEFGDVRAKINAHPTSHDANTYLIQQYLNNQNIRVDFVES